MSKKQFWIRFGLFMLFSCIIPFIFIAFRYKIFNKVSNISLSGWGLIGILIVIVFVFYIVKSINKIKKWSMTKQIFLGIFRIIIPLLCLYFALNAIKTNIDLFMQSLLMVIACESIAIPINPIPKMQEESEVDFFSKVFERKEKEE